MAGFDIFPYGRVMIFPAAVRYLLSRSSQKHGYKGVDRTRL
jgi:hypothetical protein